MSCLYSLSPSKFFLGVAKNYVQTTLDMKKNLTIVILDKLREVHVISYYVSINGTIFRSGCWDARPLYVLHKLQPRHYREVPHHP